MTNLDVLELVSLNQKKMPYNDVWVTPLHATCVLSLTKKMNDETKEKLNSLSMLDVLSFVDMENIVKLHG
jgi:hypothetical protein